MSKIHGGDIYSNKIKYDFSVSLNPLGCPVGILEAARKAAGRIEEYPDISQDKLRRELGKVYSLDPENILCCNGASEMFMAIVNMVRPKKALLPSPSFYGYEHALKSQEDCHINRFLLSSDDGFKVTEDILKELSEDTDIIFLCNPNNPTGRAIDKKLLVRIIETCRDFDITVVLDECFIELSESAKSMAGMVGDHKNLIVVKAFTKFFSMPGARFGFAMADPSVIERLGAQLPEWNISVFAEEAALAGLRLLEDGEGSSFLERTRETIAREKEFLFKELNALGPTTYPTEANFILIRSNTELYKALLQKGILIRDCSNFAGLCEGYYRIAIKDHDSNEALVAALSQML